MARTSRWKSKTAQDGIWEIELSSWKYFHDYVTQIMLDFNQYIWRGQRDSKWKLESSLDRVLKKKPNADRKELAKEHLNGFKYSTRGRRGKNPSLIETENEWWSLGQHFGLNTPLLDWTESPFVALYFAMEEATKSSTGMRAVYALFPMDTLEVNGKIEFIKPLQDENDRLVSQSGLFTRVALGLTVEECVKSIFPGVNKAYLLRIQIPEKGRLECLRTLNKMNINHLTLFPDLFGASGHNNKKLDIRKY